MPVPAKINNHLDQIDEALPVQFKDKPNIYSLIQNCAGKIQEIEDLYWSIFEQTQFYKAKGVNLDRYGFMLNKKRPAGMSDEEYFIVLAGEIIARSSDATVDGIRKRVEAVLKMFKSNIILVNNTLNWRTLDTYPDLTGSVFFYGYTTDPTRRLTGREGDILKAACPVGISTAIFGMHRTPRSLRSTTSSLWIPCEILTYPDRIIVPNPDPDPDRLVADSSDVNTDVFVVRGTNFKAYGKNWESGRLSEDGAFTTSVIVDTPSEETEFEVDYRTDTTTITDTLFFNGAGLRQDRGILLEISVSS